MSAKAQVSVTIDRPVAEVFHFIAHEHVRNHPRWDPDLQLEQVSAGPVGVGTVIRRRATRSGTLVEGTMEVVEFESNRAMGALIQDGPTEIRGRIAFEPVGQDQTTITLQVELPGVDETADMSFMLRGMERSVRNMKQLIEAER
jgi:hypothetical protein